MVVELVSSRLDDLGKIQIRIAHMNGENSVRLHVLDVQTDSFFRQEMHRNGIAGECIHDQDVELLRRFFSRFSRASPNTTFTWAAVCER